MKASSICHKSFRVAAPDGGDSPEGLVCDGDHGGQRSAGGFFNRLGLRLVVGRRAGRCNDDQRQNRTQPPAQHKENLHHACALAFILSALPSMFSLVKFSIAEQQRPSTVHSHPLGPSPGSSSHAQFKVHTTLRVCKISAWED